MENLERIPKPGELYRHFKNNLYQIITIASHTETGEQLVIYQALYGNFGVYARPLSMFNSPVDREKYPDAAQRLRFEKVEQESRRPSEEEESPNPLLLEFLEAEEIGRQIEILKRMKGKVSQKELDSIYLGAGHGSFYRGSGYSAGLAGKKPGNKKKVRWKPAAIEAGCTFCQAEEGINGF